MLIGSVALVPNPGYPTYSSAVKLSGAEPMFYDLKEENDFEPDFNQLESLITSASKGPLKGARMMFVNYPHMPTGKMASEQLFRRLVELGNRHGILIIHDNPYSFILNDRPQSLLSVEGAMDCVLELNSLSKSHNMAGWRIGMLCGAQQRIDEILRFKSNMDSGMFLPVQLAAAKALTLGEEWYRQVNEVYRQRREKAFNVLELLNCTYAVDQCGMFVWARIPTWYKDGYELSDKILYHAGVFITPGGIFGNAGDKYIRISLCSSVSVLEEACRRIESLKKQR